MQNDSDDQMQSAEHEHITIVKGTVLANEQGRLYVATGRYYFADKTKIGWHGIGFNGERVSADMPEVVAKNLNIFMRNNTDA